MLLNHSLHLAKHTEDTLLTIKRMREKKNGERVGVGKTKDVPSSENVPTVQLVF